MSSPALLLESTESLAFPYPAPGYLEGGSAIQEMIGSGRLPPDFYELDPEAQQGSLAFARMVLQQELGSPGPFSPLALPNPDGTPSKPLAAHGQTGEDNQGQVNHSLSPWLSLVAGLVLLVGAFGGTFLGHPLTGLAIAGYFALSAWVLFERKSALSWLAGLAALIFSPLVYPDIPTGATPTLALFATMLVFVLSGFILPRRLYGWTTRPL
jgi:hypothetical protein